MAGPGTVADALEIAALSSPARRAAAIAMSDVA
jgi:hypothetical protein